jgi:hypothetical protein
MGAHPANRCVRIAAGDRIPSRGRLAVIPCRVNRELSFLHEVDVFQSVMKLLQRGDEAMLTERPKSIRKRIQSAVRRWTRHQLRSIQAYRGQIRLTIREGAIQDNEQDIEWRAN